ncbi:hypothetical protein [Stutzerimonas nitrititolerans]|uniref:hypothetical protein n=1 Tax=Stutzerimonas nitrititolerans TaxID=2482751 RepID=UPI0028AC2954|nr:hypothetical protein [Stutzerimonas nitrititolerans]
MSEIERYFRLFALPIFFVVIGIISMTIMTSDGFRAVAVLADVVRVGFFISLGVVVGALIWMGWRLLLLWRWENGRLDGDCRNCFGSSGVLQGEKCMMCGGRVD